MQPITMAVTEHEKWYEFVCIEGHLVYIQQCSAAVEQCRPSQWQSQSMRKGTSLCALSGTPVYYDCGEGALNRCVVSPRPNPISHSKWGVVHHMYVPHNIITVPVHACTCSEIGLACVCKLINL